MRIITSQDNVIHIHNQNRSFVSWWEFDLIKRVWSTYFCQLMRVRFDKESMIDLLLYIRLLLGELLEHVKLSTMWLLQTMKGLFKSTNLVLWFMYLMIIDEYIGRRRNFTYMNKTEVKKAICNAYRKKKIKSDREMKEGWNCTKLSQSWNSAWLYSIRLKFI